MFSEKDVHAGGNKPLKRQGKVVGESDTGVQDLDVFAADDYDLLPFSLSPDLSHKTLKTGSVNMMDTMSNENVNYTFVDQDDITILTHHVKNFSDALAKLKVVFTKKTYFCDEGKVAAYECLGEVLCILRKVLQGYPALQSEDLFSAAVLLISKIKNFNCEEESVESAVPVFCNGIDHLALAFSSSVSEYLMCDIGEISTEDEVRTKSFEDISNIPPCSNTAEADKESGFLSTEEVVTILMQLNSGVDLALQRAKVWSKYLKDVTAYIEKKSQFEIDHAKNLARLAQSVKPALTGEGFLPLQSVYCTLLSQDVEYNSICQATQTLFQTQKFVEPLTKRRSVHDKVRKVVKETWSRELKKLQESVNNLRKARSVYYSRQHEFEKAREMAQKSEPELLSQGLAATKVDKRKKIEDEALYKSVEAETSYKACIAEANHSQEEVNRIKGELLSKIHEQIRLCDITIQKVTVEYFQLLHAVTVPLTVQYQTLCETSKRYEPGNQYAEFVCRQPLSALPPQGEQFVFEPYTSSIRFSEEQKPACQSPKGGSPPCFYFSPTSQGQMPQSKTWGPSSTHLGSDSESSRSAESSPTVSPRVASGMGSSSVEDLHDNKQERDHLTKMSSPKRTSHNRCKRIFGVALQDHVKQTQTDVPPIVKKCLIEIEKKAIAFQGLYRISGVKSKVEKLCEQLELDLDHVDLGKYPPNVISSVLKLYLRQLPEPVLTYRLYPDFIQLAKEDVLGNLSKETLIQQLWSLVDQLPQAHYSSAAVIFAHLKRVSEEADDNRMTAMNLGIVFGPTLLHLPETQESLMFLMDKDNRAQIVKLLISNADVLFRTESRSTESLNNSSETSHNMASGREKELEMSRSTSAAADDKSRTARFV